ncbi:MAG TPA: hypothetical protein VJ438_06540 [Candidatus Nanoarchaeia archaeon]|nr:hypothetical protein [Candidatus Nanoarchaeia archaeon]
MKKRGQDKKSKISILSFKKGQMQLSFGMIFSIILIIVFIAFAVYAIIKFLELQSNVQTGQFFTYVQQDVDKMWKGGQGSIEQTYNLPGEVEYICFADFTSPKKGANFQFYDNLKMAFFEFENLCLYPVGSGSGLDANQIEHINITNIVATNNPFCIQSVKGKVKMTIKMNPGDSLVTITK